MILKILLILAILIAVFAVIVSMRPSTFRVDQSIVINASPEALFPLINNQHLGDSWSPWNDNDPGMKKTFAGPEEGVGASLAWDGNNQVGAGKSTIIEIIPNRLVKMKLEFLRPFKGTNTAEFTLQPEGNGTKVTWSMYGPANFISKAMGLFMDCEKMCGDQFSKGLEKLKTLAEAKA